MQFTITDFIHNVFDFTALPDDERVCLTVKGDDGGWSNFPVTDRRLAKFIPGNGAWYFGVSSYQPPDETGYFPRDRDHACFAYCIVLDDVGTKAKEPELVPSWKLESSPGNYQWGYIIDPVDVSDPMQEAFYEGCQRALSIAGYTDDGARGTYRVMRVPGSLHRTGFVARVTHWAPTRIWDLGQLMQEFELEPLLERPRRVSAAGEAVSIDKVDDPVLEWLSNEGHTTGEVGSKFVSIVCPWHAEHTDGNITAGFTPAGYNQPEYDHAFSCFHEHCQGRGKGAFLDWVAEQGGPDPRVVVAPAAAAVVVAPAPFLIRDDLPDVQWSDKGPKVAQLSTADNIEWVLGRLGVLCRYNMMTGLSELARPGWGAREGDPNDITALLRVRSELLKLGIANDRHLSDVIENLCQRHPYHPMGEWLAGLEWDGVDRITALESTIETDSPLWPVYLRRWLVQAVEAATGWREAKQLPHVLVLSGAQGLGKSTWFSRLLPPRFFNGEVELHLSGGGKDQQVAALERPLTELSEIDTTFKKSDIGALKAFLSRPVDKIRLPYAARAIVRSRCTVFCGTVNEMGFLVDMTGSRRFWPVHADHIHHHDTDTAQLWAQVRDLHAGGYGYFLTAEEQQLSREDAEAFTVESDLQERWREYFTPGLLATPKSAWVEATAGDVFGVLGVAPSETKHPVVRRELAHLMTMTFGKQLRDKHRRYRILPLQYGEQVPEALKRHLAGVSASSGRR